jgi:type IV pilus assembly protein PilC
MPRFNFQAVTAQGAAQSGQLEAADIRQVTILLRQQGLFPTEVLSSAESKMATEAAVHRGKTDRMAENLRSVPVRWPFGKKVRPKELAVFTRQVATLLKAGMPLLRTLEVLSRQEGSGPLHEVLVSLGDAI